jgi:hypothetical protein
MISQLLEIFLRIGHISQRFEQLFDIHFLIYQLKHKLSFKSISTKWITQKWKRNKMKERDREQRARGEQRKKLPPTFVANEPQLRYWNLPKFQSIHWSCCNRTNSWSKLNSSVQSNIRDKSEIDWSIDHFEWCVLWRSEWNEWRFPHVDLDLYMKRSL